jgi:iron complex transport system permease protein
MNYSQNKRVYFSEEYWLLLLLLLAAGLSVFLGRIPCFEFGNVLITMRLSRMLAALAAGSSLSVSGVVLQSVFRNPMADPYLLGSSSGASFFIAILAFISSQMNLAAARYFPVAGFLGSFLTVLLVLFLARKDGKIPLYRLLLIGIAISFLAGSVTPILLAFSGKDLYSVFFFLNGTTQGKNLSESITYLMLAMPGLIYLFLLHKNLDYLWLGEERAYHLGFNIERSKKLLLLLSSYLTGLAVAFCGVIGFIGLVIPNIFRSRFRQSALKWLLTSSLFGATFLIVADFLARNLFFPRELPLNAMTALAGAPYFIYLLRKNDNQNS